MAELSRKRNKDFFKKLDVKLRFKEEESYLDKSRGNRLSEDLKHGESKTREKVNLKLGN